jgi:putative ribosome biogenesis GTPase RsgA
LPCSTKVRSVTRNLEVYVLPLIADAKKDDIFITCKTEKPDISQMPDNRRVIMLVGATGTGKAMLINGMVNYLLQVEWKDKFRFEVIDDNDSIGQQKPNQITTYHLLDTEYLRVPYGVTIIYTPGFEDSGLLEADKASFSHLRNFFLNPDGIGRLDAIGFVTQSSQGRLTHLL